ncbi:MAG: tetratricopeptide repeat protein [Candidatus Peribacteraceae bacterium]|nr:tetratricopeptide repeat protein [Candidatus Peribacteraceae bacterium]
MPDSSALPKLPDRFTLWSIIGGFALLLLAVYGASLSNGFVAWDDTLLIYFNQTTHGLSWPHIVQAFSRYDPELYIPLTYISYQFDYTIAGLAPWFYHLHNLILHAISSVLVVWLGYVLTKNRYVALTTGILFAIHPLNTEAVAWASGRKDTVSTLWFLAAAILYIYYRHSSKKKYLLYTLSIVAFAIGLLAKVMIITLPAVLLLIDYLHNRKWSIGVIVDKIPYGILSIIFGIVALFGKKDISAASTLSEKFLMAGKSTVFYIEKIFLPINLSVIYQYTKPITLSSPDFYIPLILVICLLIAIIICFIKRLRMAAFGLSFFLITVIPTFINFAKAGSLYYASDRYVYIPAIGIFLLASSTLYEFFLRRAHGAMHERQLQTLLGVTGVVIIILSALTFRQSLVWRNSLTLFENTVKHYPDSSTGHFLLGAMYEEIKENDNALREYKLALEKEPHASIHNGIGSILQKKGDLIGAEKEFRTALEMDPINGQSHFALGVLLKLKNDEVGAEREYREALRLDDQYVAAYNNLGSLLMDRGDLTEAKQMFEKSIRYNPDFADAHFNLSSIYRHDGDIDNAIKELKEAIRIKPKSVDAYIALADIYVQTGKYTLALTNLKQALAHEPANADAKAMVAGMVKAGILGTKNE